MGARGRHRKRGGLARSLGALLAVVVALGLAGVFARSAFQPGTTPTRATGSTPPASPSVSPLASPSPSLSPSPRATAPAGRGRLVIHGTGDVSVDPNYIPNFRSYGYGYAWSGLNGLFKRDDLTVVNLECAVSRLGSPVPKKFNFRGDPAALPAMRAAGVEVANMANNHSYDFGPQALMDEREQLRRNDIAPIGAGADPQEALSPALFTIRGWRVAVLGFDKVVDPYPEAVARPGHPGTAAGHNEAAMIGAVKAAAGVADVVVVMIHWGVELDTQPRASEVSLAHRLVQAGADVIFGGHSHRLQPMESYRGRPIFYSLGNFVWPNLSAAGATTAVAEVTISPSGEVTGRLLPAYIESAGHPVLRGS
ncbi:MAG: CapA family protein [Actinobacteria bacterium]|nr:MAG: CapA family protein [Actinomycetota bacterium]TMK96320.1 MAG: CapA family protein [Actinomycetota bacterium]